MQLATIQQRVEAGYAAAVARLGSVGTQYRPASALTPLAEVHATPMMAFDSPAAFGFSAPADWGAPMRHALMDSTDVLAGDVLVSGSDTYFVARVESLRPPLCVLCDRVVSVAGAAGSAAQVVAGCPVSIVMRAHGEHMNTGMPGSLRPGEFLMIMPGLPGVVLTPYMVVTTDLGTSYTVVAVEVSPFGLRCTIATQQV